MKAGTHPAQGPRHQTGRGRVLIIVGVLGGIFTLLVLPRLQKDAQEGRIGADVKNTAACEQQLLRQLHGDPRRPDPPRTEPVRDACRFN